MRDAPDQPPPADSDRSGLRGISSFIAGEIQAEQDFAIPTIDVYRQPEISEDTRTRIERIRKTTNTIKQRALPVRAADARQEKYKIDYQSELNARQLEVVTTLEGPVLVIAGAGSGKTRAIVYRVAYLLENGVAPESILMLTFTRKAAKEMLSRVDALLRASSGARVLGGTFHSVANHLLRRYASMLGISPNYTILDTGDAEDVLDLVRKNLGLNQRERAFPTKHRIQAILSQARNLKQPLEELLADDLIGLAEYVPDLRTIYEQYVEYKLANNLLDFDDLIELVHAFLKSNRAFAQKIWDRFSYIMVDEFQDTNIPQKDLVVELARRDQNIMVVGDDAQSIYSFRGANFENILRFPETYPQCAIIMMEQNYRSKQDILAFTNSIMQHSIIGYQKKLFSQITNRGMPRLLRFFGAEEEARWIVAEILEYRERDMPLNEIAVLYRSTFHANYIQVELTRRGIPYVVYGGIRFSERRHVKDIIAYLRLSLNPVDAVAWTRILKLVPGVGAVTSTKIVAYVRERDGEIDFEAFPIKKHANELAILQNLLKRIAAEDLAPAEKVTLVRSYYAFMLKELYVDFEKRLLDTDVLVNLAAGYASVEQLLTDFALDPPSTRFQNDTVPSVNRNERDRLVLSTIHSAKGLEWGVVFVPHLLDGLFPSDRALNSIESLEEERRMFYVACTRTRNQLNLTLPATVGGWAGTFTLPSRFLAEVARDLYTYRAVPEIPANDTGSDHCRQERETLK